MALKRPTIVIDTREKNPIHFKSIKTEVMALKSGDYSLKGMVGDITVERKSIQDLFGSFLSGSLEKQLSRMKDKKLKALLIEGKIMDIVFGSKYTKADGRSVLKEVIGLCFKYDVLILFSENRTSSQELVKAFLLSAHKHLKIH